MLEGAWIGNQFTDLRYTRDIDGQPIPFTPRGQEILDRRVKATYVDSTPYANAAAYCIPPGMAWQVGVLYPFQILQTKSAVIFIFSEYHTVWSVPLDARPDRPPEYMGNARGRWDGDTLVVETDNYKQPTWIDADGSPTSDKAKITFRIKRIVNTDGTPGLEIVTTIDDAEMYTRPWSFSRTFVWRPDMEYFIEYDCESRVSGPDAISQFGLQPEPAQ